MTKKNLCLPRHDLRLCLPRHDLPPANKTTPARFAALRHLRRGRGLWLGLLSSPGLGCTTTSIVAVPVWGVFGLLRPPADSAFAPQSLGWTR